MCQLGEEYARLEQERQAAAAFLEASGHASGAARAQLENLFRKTSLELYNEDVQIRADLLDPPSPAAEELVAQAQGLGLARVLRELRQARAATRDCWTPCRECVACTQCVVDCVQCVTTLSSLAAIESTAAAFGMPFSPTAACMRPRPVARERLRGRA